MKNLHICFKSVLFIVLGLNITVSALAQCSWDTIVPYAVTDPHSISYGDFNNDNAIDLLICNYYSSSMTMMLNDGHGAFSISGIVPTHSYPHVPAIADFNNDGNLDFAQSHSSGYNADNKVSVHLGLGDGSFQDYDIYTVWGNFTYFSDAGDVNGDGYMDIAVTSAGWPDCFSLLINNGDGTFVTGNHYPAATETGILQLVDLNADNNLDAVLGCGAYGTGYQLDVYFGDGTGGFDNRTSYPTPINKGRANPYGTMDADLDGDIDIVLNINGSADNALYLMRNDGVGNLTYELIADGGWRFAQTCDWNNDGYMDILDSRKPVGTNEYLESAIFINNTQGQFTDTITIKTGTNKAYYGKDLNNDQLIDLLDLYWENDTVNIQLQKLASYTQQFNLTAGWNKISWNVMPQQPNFDSILQDLVTGESLIKVIDEQGLIMQQMPWGWENNIGEIQQAEGYWLKMSESDTLYTTGFPLPLPMQIDLSAGWNIISCPIQAERNAISMFQNLIDSGFLIKVIDNEGNILQQMPWGWVNNIGNVKPGEGYQVKVNGVCAFIVNL